MVQSSKFKVQSIFRGKPWKYKKTEKEIERFLLLGQTDTNGSKFKVQSSK
jgi:hypothetical protein